MIIYNYSDLICCWDGYYLGKKMGEWNNEYGSKATRRKGKNCEINQHRGTEGAKLHREYFCEACHSESSEESLFFNPVGMCYW